MKTKCRSDDKLLSSGIYVISGDESVGQVTDHKVWGCTTLIERT